MHWSWHVGRGWEGLRWNWRCLCWYKVALFKFGDLEVETGRFQIYAVQESDNYAKMLCEMQEVQRTSSKAARGRLGSGYFGPIHFSLSTTSSLNE